MILYYAIGGGLGHLTRGRRVLETLGLAHDAAFVTASRYANDPRVTAGIPVIEIPADLEHHPDTHRDWLRTLDAERLIADTFPGGIQGELCGLDLAMDHVARRLQWTEYRRTVPGPLPSFGTTWILEDLEPDHESFLRANSQQLAPLTLAHVILADAPAPRENFWLIVHSGPEDEVRELIAYATELRALTSDPPSRILVATRSPVSLPPGFELTDVYPAAPLFPHATRILTAAGFNVMHETEPWRTKHEIVPFPRRYDDQFARAATRRDSSPRTQP